METPQTPLTLAARPPFAALSPWWGAGAMGAGLAVALLYLYSSYYAGLLLGMIATGTLTLAALRWPALLLGGLLAVAPFNYGQYLGGGIIKLSEGVTGLMLLVILLQLAVGNRAVWGRLRRGGAVAMALGLLAVMAMATAAPHPNFFNVRYEVQCYVALMYGLLFFRRAHWPMLIGLFGALALIESLVALWLRFGLDLTGWSFFGEGGGVQHIYLTQEDLESFAGGLFRLSGTMGHKNLLAAFYVLLLPLVALESLQHHPLRGLIVLGPALATLALTDSMTGWGATALILVVTLVHLRRFDYLAFVCLLALPVAAFAAIKFGGSMFYRIEQLFGGGEEGWGTVSSRLQMLTISRDLVLNHPWMGIGRNNFAYYGQTYYTHAHNLFLMKTIEMGVPAGVLFTGFLIAVMGRTWQALGLEAARLAGAGEYYRYLGLWLGCLGFVAMNLFDYSYANFSLGPVFMLMLGMLLAVAWGLGEGIPRNAQQGKSH